MSLPCLFLDRDGVLVEEVDFLCDPDQVVLTPGAGEAIFEVNRAGIPVVVVTNQSGVGRGLFTEAQVRSVHDRIDRDLAAYGARIDRYYHCPHHPIHGLGPLRIACECRKPRPGMLLMAAAEMNLNLSRSWLVGDKLTDLEAGANAGCRSILVRTGYGSNLAEERLLDAKFNLAHIARNMSDAVAFCLPCLRERTG